MELPGEKLVMRLWETLAEKGIGSLLSPWQVGREGRARIEVRRQEILMLAQAEKDAADIRAGKKQLLPEGVILLTNSQTAASVEDEVLIKRTLAISDAINYGNRSAVAAVARSVINTAKAIIFAEEQLSSDTQTPPPRDVDEDWLLVWREHAGKVSVEDLQRLWGSVLAGEVKAPGRYSIRTLEFLKTLSKAEAVMISSLASYVIDGRIARAQMAYIESKGINFSMLLVMQELGVISGVESIGLTSTHKSAAGEKFVRAFVSHNKALIAEHLDHSKTLEYKVYIVTEVGRQLLGLGSFQADLEYLRLIGKEFVSKGFSVTLADWSVISETEGAYSNGEKILGGDPAGEA